MSNIYNYLDDEDQSIIESVSSRENITEVVDSLTKWVSTVEDKVTLLTEKVEALSEQMNRNHTESMHLLKAILQSSQKQEASKRRFETLSICNRELALGLSDKLFRSEAKRAKIDPKSIPKETLHPSVMPFVFVDDVDDKATSVDKE